MHRHVTQGHIENLVFDIGMHTGQDTANYLDKGFRVVAIEANPELVEYCENRFSRSIKTGRLTIISGAIAPNDNTEEGKKYVEFFPHCNSAWGTIAPENSEYASRINNGVSGVRVPIVDLLDLLEGYGTPYYMKIDIEGADKLCLQALTSQRCVPPYISLESSVDSYQAVKEELGLLENLGYSAFQIINQKDIEANKLPDSLFEYGGSGDFGKWLPDSNWICKQATDRKYRELFLWYKLFSRQGLLRNTPLQRPLTRWLSSVKGYTIPSWYDTHARHGDVCS